MSKPRCTQSGCDGEHTPSVHKLMGEESVSVNLVTEDESEDESEDKDEDEGWWVGTVGVTEMPDHVEEILGEMIGPGSGQGQEGYCTEAGSGYRVEEELEYPLDDCSAGEVAEDKWWGLGSTQPHSEEGGAGAQYPPTTRLPRNNMVQTPRATSAKRRKLRKRPETTSDQDWEEARRDAWLRQMLSDTSSDEGEERYGRFAES